MEMEKMMNAEAIAPIVIAIAARMKKEGVCDKLEEKGFFDIILDLIRGVLDTIFPGILQIIETFIDLEDLAKKVCEGLLGK